MRMMLKIKMPTDSGNRAIKDRSLGKLLRHGQQTEGGGCLFCCRGRCPMRADFSRHEGFGGDTGHSRIIAEPLFIGLGAELELVPAMNADDLRKGLKTAMQAM